MIKSDEMNILEEDVYKRVDSFTHKTLDLSSPLSVGIVDLSWLIYRNFFSQTALSHSRIPLRKEFGDKPVDLPTQHIYSTISQIYNFSKRVDVVILAGDSHPKWRYDIFPEYKAGRVREKTGDPFKDYRPFDDFPSIQRICCSISNIFYSELPEMESDDIISSFILTTNTVPNLKLWAIFKDSDILQTPGIYKWSSAMDGSVSSIKHAVQTYAKYPLAPEQPLWDFLPLWHKVIRGCSTDKIGPSFMRFPTKLLLPLCTDLEKTWSFDDFKKYLKKKACQDPSYKNWVPVIRDEGHEFWAKAERNYKIIKPFYTPLEKISLTKPKDVWEKVSHLYKFYGINEEQLHDLTPSVEGEVTTSSALPSGPSQVEITSETAPYVMGVEEFNQYLKS